MNAKSIIANAAVLLGVAGSAAYVAKTEDTEHRVGYCVVNLAPRTKAGTYDFTCDYSDPLPEDCEQPAVVLTPATLDDLDTPDNTVRWLPGIDYDYWLIGIGNEGECDGVFRDSFMGYIHTKRKVGKNPVGIGFSYIADART